ncbi:MAG: endonuclease I [Oxalobacteraceae bacterium]|nr:MAG: endonuclease I [Oxalobacteraceae bacterium]
MKYRSKFEKDFAAKHKDAKYESVKIKYTIEHTYNPDWVLPNGIMIETKGLWTGQDRNKHLAVKKQHPGIDIRFVFMANNKLRKGSKTTYGAWCDAKGFKWAIGSVPPAWLREPRASAR